MEVLPYTGNIATNNKLKVPFQQSPNTSLDEQDPSTIIWDAKAQGVNKKLMRLAVDTRISTKRQSYLEDAAPLIQHPPKLHLPESSEHIASLDTTTPVSVISIIQCPDGGSQNARFPRMEEMSHFHYSSVDFINPLSLRLNTEEHSDLENYDTGQEFSIEVTGTESWTLKRTYEDFVGLDRQLHRCLYDRRYSQLPPLKDIPPEEKITPTMVHQLQSYLTRFSDVAGNNINCGPVLNWLELDNHGNHLVVMEADDSAINVPAVAAGRVIKRYQAQAADEMTLDVGEFLSIIDMPQADETIWWRGKKGFEVGFFPSHCIEVIGEKEINEKIIAHLQSQRPIIKRRGKFVSFLRFFFRSRPSKDDLMQQGILRERVFGCDLGEYLAQTGRDIPLVLQMCSDMVEQNGIVDGIYRLSGILSNLQKLRVSFDSEAEPPNLHDPRFLNDIHCISSLLKTYFRELPNPLFTYELYTKFVVAINKEDDTEKTVAFHHVIQRLPPPHYRTMNYLLRHLNYCAQRHHETNMTAKNLAIVWAPNLLRPNIEDNVAALTEFRTQAIIVEYMIRNVDVFFDKNVASAAIAYYPELLQETPQANNDETPSSVENTFAPPVSTGPKLISLEEAQERVKKKGQSSSGSDTSSSQRSRQQHSMNHPPPQVAASPISPLPSLLSLEEAQARTKHHHHRRPSVDLVDFRSASPPVQSSTANLVINSPKRGRKWLGLFLRNKSPPEDMVRNVAMYKTISSPKSSITEFDIQAIRKQQIEHPSLDSSNTSPAGRHSPLFASREKPTSDGDDSSLMSAMESISKKYGSVGSSVGSMLQPRSKTMNVDIRHMFDKTKMNKSISSSDVRSSTHDNPVAYEPCSHLSNEKIDKQVEKPISPPKVLQQDKPSKPSPPKPIVTRVVVNEIPNKLSVSEIQQIESKNDEVIGNEKHAVIDTNNKRSSPERTHRSFDSVEEVPNKKTRSLSPDCRDQKSFEKEANMSIENIDQQEMRSAVSEFNVSSCDDRSMKVRSASFDIEHPRQGSFGSAFQLVSSPPKKTEDASGQEKAKSARNLQHIAQTSTIHPLFNNKKRSGSLQPTPSPNHSITRPASSYHPPHKSQDEQKLDSLVRRTTESIKTGRLSNIAVVPPKNKTVEFPPKSSAETSNNYVNVSTSANASNINLSSTGDLRSQDTEPLQKVHAKYVNMPDESLQRRAMSVKDRIHQIDDVHSSQQALNSRAPLKPDLSRSTPHLNSSKPPMVGRPPKPLPSDRHSSYIPDQTSSDRLVNSSIKRLNKPKPPPAPLPKYIDLRPSYARTQSSDNFYSPKTELERMVSDDPPPALFLRNKKTINANRRPRSAYFPTVEGSLSKSDKNISQYNKFPLKLNNGYRPRPLSLHASPLYQYDDLQTVHYDML